MRRKVKFYRINHYITAPEVRVVSEKGESIGVLTREKALSLAGRKGLDLVEIAPKVSPPVCKIIDFKKFIYEEAKKQRKSKKQSARQEIKELRMSLFIAKHDFQRRINQAKKFLEGGEIVTFKLFFKGRQINKKDLGLSLFQKAKEALTDISKVSLEPIIKGKILEMTLKPVKK